MANVVKINKSEFETLLSSVEKVKNLIGDSSSGIVCNLSSFTNAADSYANNFDNYKNRAKLYKHFAYSNGVSRSISRSNYGEGEAGDIEFDNDCLTAAGYWIEQQKKNYIDYNSKLDVKVGDITTRIAALYDALKDISEAYNAFENDTSLNFEDYLVEFVVDNNLEGSAWEYSTITLTLPDGSTTDYDIPILKIEIDGNLYTVPEAVNCVMTSFGTVPSGAVAISSTYGDDIDYSVLDDYFANVRASNNKFLESGFYSVVHSAGIEAMYEDAMGHEFGSVDYSSVLSKYVTKDGFMDEEEVSRHLSDETLGFTSGLTTVAGLFMGAYSSVSDDGDVTYNTLTEEEKESLGFNKVKNNEEPPTEEPSNEPADTPVNNPTNNGTPATGTPDSGRGDTQVDNPETPEEETTEEVPEEEVHEEYEEQYEEIEDVIEEADEDLEDIKEDFEETDTEEIQEENKEITEEFIDDQAKDDYFDKVNENDGDNSLREEIAEKTESFENRFIENQNNPTDAGTQEIKAELKELGYDDAAIDKIMSGDPTVAKNAFKVGVQDQEMAKIANELAEKAGIEDFDTSYDDSQSYDSLHDGTVNVELTDHDRFIDTLRPESGSNAETPKVVTEYDEYQQAETDFVEAKESYEEIYTETNKSIEAAETAKADLDKYLTDLKEKSGEDPTKWSEDEIKELNKLTTTYNTKVEEANENNEKYLKQYKEYKEARDSFNKEKGEYYDELLDFYQKELGIDKSNNNNNPTPSTPVVKEPDNSNYTDESFIHMINNGNGINWDDANELLNK